MGLPEAGLGQDSQGKQRLWEATLRPGGPGSRYRMLCYREGHCHEQRAFNSTGEVGRW